MDRLEVLEEFTKNNFSQTCGCDCNKVMFEELEPQLRTEPAVPWAEQGSPLLADTSWGRNWAKQWRAQSGSVLVEKDEVLTCMVCQPHAARPWD